MSTQTPNSVELRISPLKKVEDDTNSLFETLNQNDPHCVEQFHSSDYSMESEKEKELWQYLQQLKMEYDEKIHDLETSLDHVTRENEAYESQITALKQHNRYLSDTSNQYHTRYNQARISLLNADEEIINVKREITDLQILYEHDMKRMQYDQCTIVPHEPLNEDDLKHTLNEYKTENQLIKQQSVNYLNQLKDLNHKYKETTTKYTDIHNVNMALQNELCSSKLLVSDLERVAHERFLEIRHLEHQTSDLKQALHEISTPDDLFDSDIMEIELTPDVLYSKHRWRDRRRSMSQSSVKSDSGHTSPIVKRMSSVFSMSDWNNMWYADCMDRDVLPNLPSAILEDAANDLYQQMNDYLFEIVECVQTMKTLQAFHRRIPMKHRNSIPMKHDGDNMEKDEKTEEVDVIQKKETLLHIFNTDQEEQLLMQIQDIVERCKDSMSEIHTQQRIMMMNERQKYEDLDTVFEIYQSNAVRKLKRLTKDVYNVKYKRYSGYKHICWEMVGKVSTHTKDAIVHKLTH